MALITELKMFQGSLGTVVQVFDGSELVAGYLMRGVAENPPVEVPNVPPAPKPDNSVMPKIDITEYDSPNCSTRAATITHVILHNTAGAFKPSIDWLCKSEAQASAHLVISREGKTACLVDFSKASWHAGSREWNHRSLGIEIEDFDDIPGMPAAQEAKVLAWCRWLMQRYNIKPENIRTHRSVLPGETDCPVLVWPKESDFLAWRKKHFGV